MGFIRKRRRLWPTLVDLSLGLVIVVVVIVSLMPLELTGSIDQGLAELADGLGLHLDDSISVSLVQRLIVYLPLGLLVYAAIARRRLAFAFVGTILTVAAIGIAIEMLQAFISKRHPLSLDVVLILAVGITAALLGEIVRTFGTRPRIACLQLLLLGNIIALSAIWLAHRGSDLESWDCSYPLIIGNEATADRPWLGKLRGFAIYAQALGETEIEGLAAGFGEGGAPVDRRRLGAELVRSFERQGELAIEHPATIEAIDDASGLCAAIKAEEAFTIEIEFASQGLDQRGPARILSMSLDPERRNVTLGQDGDRLSLRIRNELNGENGIERQMLTADGVISGDWQHWVARYDKGMTTLFLDGEILDPSLDYESILLVSGRTSLPLAVICGVISFVLGAAASGWLQQRITSIPTHLSSAAVLALAPQTILIAVIALTDHRLLALSFMSTIIAAALAGALLAWWLGRSRDRLATLGQAVS